MVWRSQLDSELQALPWTPQGMSEVKYHLHNHQGGLGMIFGGQGLQWFIRNVNNVCKLCCHSRDAHV